MPDELTRALRRLVPPRVGREASPVPAPFPLASDARPFEAALAAPRPARGSVEADLAEVRGRVNGLLFVVAGAAITQIAMRLLA